MESAYKHPPCRWDMRRADGFTRIWRIRRRASFSLWCIPGQLSAVGPR